MQVQEWRKTNFLLQAGREDVSNFGGKSGSFGKSLDYCVQKVVVGGEDFGGGGRRSPVGRRVSLEDIVGLEGVSGPMGEGLAVLQKAQGVNGLAVGEKGGLGRVQLRDPSLLKEEGSVGVDSPLGLLVGDNGAAETVPVEWFKSPLAWILGTDEALQVEVTRYSSHPFPLVFQGAQGFSSSSSLFCRKRAAEGVRSHGCGSGTKVVEADVSIRPLNIVGRIMFWG